MTMPTHIVHPVDSAAINLLLYPMLIHKPVNLQGTDQDVICEFYLENIYIASGRKLFSVLTWLFSEKAQGIAIALASSLLLSWACKNLTVTFCNISVITEDIYLKLRLFKKQSIVLRETIQNEFFHFFRIMPFFDLDF